MVRRRRKMVEENVEWRRRRTVVAAEMLYPIKYVDGFVGNYKLI